MKKEFFVREHSSYRLNLVDIFKNHTEYLARQKEKDGKIYYEVVSSLEEANAFRIGQAVVDGYSKLNYRIFTESVEEKKRKGKKVYSVEVSKETNPQKLGRKQIRLYVSADDKNFKSAVLRFYEITYIIHTLRTETDDEKFWHWINCDSRDLQINHITGEYTNSGNVAMLEICTQRENLLHGRALRYFRKVTNGLNSLFLATAKDCVDARDELQREKGVEYVESCDLYDFLLNHNKIVVEAF